jgi:hypothetical protein
MIQILEIDQRFTGKSSDELGVLIGVSGAAVRGYGTWKKLHPKNGKSEG